MFPQRYRRMSKNALSAQARQRLDNYIANPPQGSALRAAIDFGIDPTMTLKAMFVLTPQERLANANKVVRSTATMLGIARMK